jgi:hypothetical protein
MHRSAFARIENHPLRHVLRNVCNDPRDLPTKSQLRAELVEALPGADAKVIDALVTKAAEFAQAAVDPGARFDLRGAADRLTLHVVDTLEADDRLVPVEDEEPVDVSDVMGSIDGYDPTNRPATPAQIAARQAADIESARRLAGGQS